MEVQVVSDVAVGYDGQRISTSLSEYILNGKPALNKLHEGDEGSGLSGLMYF